MSAWPDLLYLKHRLVTSRLGDGLLRARQLTRLPQLIRHPELALLRHEDLMMRQLVRRMLPPDAVCVDVGCHIGSIAQLFRQTAPRGRHILIEASPTKAAWLRKSFPEASVHQVAVSDTVGETSFYENLDQSGFSSLNEREIRGRTTKVQVQCTTLDRLLADQPRVDIIKIDVEGFEYPVVQGAVATLQRLRPRLIFEAGAAADQDIDNESYVNLFRLLTGPLGYDIRPVFGALFGRPPIREEDFMAYRTYPFMAFNYVATPAGMPA